MASLPAGSTWASAVVAALIEFRYEGYTHDQAWRLAMRRYPPSGSWDGSETLFDTNGEKVVTLVGFLFTATENAWLNIRDVAGSGNGPAIRSFRLEMLRESDASSSARHVGGRARLAA